MCIRDSNSTNWTLLFDPNQPNTFIHYSGNTTNPDLAMASSNIAEKCNRKVIGDPGSGHRMTVTKVVIKNGIKKKPKVKARWNFKKANWEKYKRLVDEKALEMESRDTPYNKLKKFCEIMKKSAKDSIPQGTVYRYKPFWNKELNEQWIKRDNARKEAERSQGKSDEERRNDVVKWRKESAVLKSCLLYTSRCV